MPNPLLSVIIPVYNAEKYLEKCIQSVINQTFQQFELILVNDGSTDSSGKICDEFAQEDSRIRVIHKQNGGPMSACEKGLEEADTDNIIFIDSDDWIASRMFEILFRERKRHQADVVICNICNVKDGVKHREDFIMDSGYYDATKIKSDIYPVMLNAGKFLLRGIHISRWGKLLKKEVLQNNLKYCDTHISYAEDLNLIFPALLDCHSLVIVDDKEADYYYQWNPLSIMNSYKKTMYQQVQLVYERLFQAIKDKEKMEFEGQLLADYLANIVQCYKNELMNPAGFKAAKQNIDILCSDYLLVRAANEVNWYGYNQLNKWIIYIMCHWNMLTRNVLTFFLYCVKRYQMKTLKHLE